MMICLMITIFFLTDTERTLLPSTRTKRENADDCRLDSRPNSAHYVITWRNGTAGLVQPNYIFINERSACALTCDVIGHFGGKQLRQIPNHQSWILVYLRCIDEVLRSFLLFNTSGHIFVCVLKADDSLFESMYLAILQWRAITAA